MTCAGNNEDSALPQGSLHRGQAITRALVREALLDSEDDEEVGLDPWKPDVVEASYAQRAPDGGAMLASTNADLQATRNWLAELVEQERSKADWGSEFQFERSVPRPERTSKEDKATLERISKGHGPRALEYEDILAPLRLHDPNQNGASESRSFFEETYEDQVEVLLDWNRKVASIPDLTKEREKLYNVLEERCQMMLEVEQGLRNPGDIDEQSSRVRKALRAFRPEIAKFENRSSLHILVVIIANFRVAQPDIDLEMRDKMIETILKEIRLMMRSDKRHDVRDRQLEARLQSAYESNDRTVVRCLRKEKKDLYKEDMRLYAEKMIDHIKTARRPVYQQVLAELQDLAVSQTGLKLVALEQLSIPYGLLRKSLENEDAIKHMQELLLNAEAACDADLANVANMLGLTHDCYERVERFRAEDVGRVTGMERECIRLKRMEDPKTYNMMMRVVDDRQAISQIPTIVRAHMTELDESLGLASGVARNQLQELDGWEGGLLDENTEVDFGLALVGKLILEASAKEGIGRPGTCTKDAGEDEAEVRVGWL